MEHSEPPMSAPVPGPAATPLPRCRVVGMTGARSRMDSTGLSNNALATLAVLLPALAIPELSADNLVATHAALSPHARGDLIAAVRNLDDDVLADADVADDDHTGLVAELHRDYHARHGVTPAARAAFDTALQEMGVEVLHHGDCVGADATAHIVALEQGLHIVVHPPTHDIHRAWCLGPPATTTTLPPLAYITRNRKIVDAVALLVVLPHGYEQEVRSGTWSTYRYARGIGKQGRKVPIATLIIYPNGSRKYELGATLAF